MGSLSLIVTVSGVTEAEAPAKKAAIEALLGQDATVENGEYRAQI
jgi:hypothetical protein